MGGVLGHRRWMKKLWVFRAVAGSVEFRKEPLEVCAGIKLCKRPRGRQGCFQR